MKRWLFAALIAVVSVVVGGVFYSTLLIDTFLQRSVAFGVGLFVGVSVYVAAGFIERHFLPSHRPSEPRASPLRAWFARSPGFWQVPRLVVAAYLGLLFDALALNALFQRPLNWLASVVVGVVAAAALWVGINRYQQRSLS